MPVGTRKKNPASLSGGKAASKTRRRQSAEDTARGARPAKRIALFNHKGGVSKTTTTFHLGWMLAAKGKRVIMVDADPQCNLTGVVMGYSGLSELDQFYQKEPERNIAAGLAPAFEAQPRLIEPVDCVEVSARPGLFLLPGSIKLAEYEVQLGIAQELSNSLQALQNLPGSLAYLLEKTAAKFKADYLLIDMSPSLSSINQNLLMTSDYFIVPASPDYFSVMAIDSLTNFLPRWGTWLNRAHSLQVLQQATYPFPKTVPKLLGTIIQKYRPRAGKASTPFQKWIDAINTLVRNRLKPALEQYAMLLPNKTYSSAKVNDDLNLATISDFNSLIARSQELSTPVFALTEDQIGHGGQILELTVKSRDAFGEAFDDLANKVIKLTT